MIAVKAMSLLGQPLSLISGLDDCSDFESLLDDFSAVLDQRVERVFHEPMSFKIE